MNFDEKIKQIYRNEISDKGECPPSDDLIRYQRREASMEEMLRIKRHIDNCGICDSAVVQLSEIDSAPVFDWKESLKRILLHPALAYGIALALLYPAYLGLSNRAAQGVVSRAGSARDFDLGQGSVTRSTSSAEPTVVSLPPNDQFVILTFFVPVRSSYRYEMEIRNELGSLIDSEAIHSRDSIGNFSIVAASSAFADGKYKLNVKETEPSNGVMKNEYAFHFYIERK